MTDQFYARARILHIAASMGAALIALAHSLLTWYFYATWAPEAVWFLGTGLGLLLLAALNLSHIGLEPCHMPTTRLVRLANWVFLAFAIAASVAVPEPQAYLLTLLVLVQAIVSRWTLPGPG